jgi:hypothetical protein
MLLRFLGYLILGSDNDTSSSHQKISVFLKGSTSLPFVNTGGISDLVDCLHPKSEKAVKVSGCTVDSDC